MARHHISERRFEVEMPDGAILYGYPLTIALEREFVRDGVWDLLLHGERHPAENVVAALIRVLAAVFRKDEAFVEATFTATQAAELLRVVVLESRPQPKAEDPKAQASQ